MKRFKRHLIEDAIPSFVTQELIRYNKGAGKKLDTKVIQYVDEYKPSGEITLYRGLGFDVVDGPKILKKFKINKLENGVTGIYKTDKIQSWSTTKQQANEFAGLFISKDLRDPSSLGIIISIIVKPEDIAVAMDMLPPEVKKKFPSEHYEYLLHPGKYTFKIEEFKGEWPKENINKPY